MIRVSLYIFLGLAVWIGAHSLVVIVFGLTAEPQPSDVAVVLGARVERSGVPSLNLRDRLERTLELHRSGMVKQIIVSGGLGSEGFQEGDVMRDYLGRYGVPSQVIFVDRNGDDTYETVRNAKAIMAAQGFTSVVAVSHYYHLLRAVVTFKRFGITNVSAAAVKFTPAWQDPYNVLREFAAFYFYLVRDYAPT